MKISALFRQLSTQELSNLAMSNSGSGEILPASHSKLLGYTNDALLRLYSRYVLSEKSVIIEQLEYVTNYHLKRKYAESSGSNAEYHYIKDLQAEPFEEDVIKILEVWDVHGNPRPLNDTGHSMSLFTPKPDTLQIPSPVEGQALSVTYQARHPVLKDTGEHLLNQEFEMPFFLEQAVQSYVAYKVYFHMNGQENAAIAQNHLGQYEAICGENVEKDLVNNTNINSHNKLDARGFV